MQTTFPDKRPSLLLGSPIFQGSSAGYQFVNGRSVAHKLRTLDMGEAAAIPLTYATEYEALVERLQIQRGEQAVLLIINGGGGVGSVASQIVREV